MARVQRLDRGLASRLDELEQRMFLLKLEYEKYFSGIEPLEPTRERDGVRRMLRDLQQERITNSAQVYRLRMLRARFTSLEQYFTRNLLMVERGTHPRMRFRADLHERQKGVTPPPAERAAPPPKVDPEPRGNDDEAYRAIFDRYLDARRSCGQQAEMSYESVREVLKKQVATIKSRYHCNTVKFRVTVEDGKAKVKAVPMK